MDADGVVDMGGEGLTAFVAIEQRRKDRVRKRRRNEHRIGVQRLLDERTDLAGGGRILGQLGVVLGAGGLVAGDGFGLRSPVPVYSDLMYADVHLEAGTRFKVPPDHVERAAYVIHGGVGIEGQDGVFPPNQLVIFRPGAEVILVATEPTRLVLIGGEPFPEKRHIYWNFVSSSKERIEAAKADWRARRFPEIVGETEFIPLPPDPVGLRIKD